MRSFLLNRTSRGLQHGSRGEGQRPRWAGAVVDVPGSLADHRNLARHGTERAPLHALGFRRRKRELRGAQARAACGTRLATMPPAMASLPWLSYGWIVILLHGSPARRPRMGLP